MHLGPWKFFIGLIDFLSILLPGAPFTLLLMGEMGPAMLGKVMARVPVNNQVFIHP